MQKKQNIILSILLLILFSTANAQFVFNTNSDVYTRILTNTYLVINNPSPAGISTSSVANIISEGETNAVKWAIGNNTGNYVVPFTTHSLVKIPLEVNITNAGVSTNGDVIFSTYETATDKNLPYPSDVTNLNSNCKDSVGLQAVDRFWRIEAENYTSKPTPVINFGFDNAANEVAVTNTINVGALKAMRFNNTINSWETPQKLYGFGAANSVNNSIVASTDFYKSWTLVDSTIMNLPVAVTSGSLINICNGSSAVITVTGATSYTLIPSNDFSSGSFTVLPTTNTIYNIIGSIGSGTAVCTSYTNSVTQVSVNVNTLPLVSTQVTTINCNGNNNGAITSSVTSTNAHGYLWSNGATTGGITNLTAGVYTLTVTDINNCKATQTATITEPSAMIVTEINNTISCDDKPTGAITIDVLGGSPTYSVVWSNGTSGLTNNQIAAGNYTATVTDANGCIQFFSSIVNEEKCLITFIPQLFSPNADGKNDLFFINTISYFPNNKLEIYNRWGNLIYSKNKYDNTFDGKANVSNSIGNGLLPAGTYFVVFDFGDAKTEPYKGYLEIRY